MECLGRVRTCEDPVKKRNMEDISSPKDVWEEDEVGGILVRCFVAS